MGYNFDIPVNRRGTESYKWDSDPDADVLPLWVADMDFPTAPCIVEALQKRVAEGVFGYVKVSESYYEALAGWFADRHGWVIDPEMVIYTSGVVPAISAIVMMLTQPGNGVILQTPAYNCFFSSIRNNGCVAVENTLLRRETAEGLSFEIDFDLLERQASDPANVLLLLCNPHNPTGRVWTRPELEKVRDICRCHGVRVVSDEIHCELVHPGFRYIPYATVDDGAVVCCSPSKAFNIAGLQIANIVAPDGAMRARIDRGININEVCDVNPFGVIALREAYTHGAEWLDALNKYLYSNYLFLREYLAERMPQLKVCNSESTYLAWIDITPLGLSSEEVEEHARRQGRVWVNAGDMYGGSGYVRINYACPRVRLEEGLRRFCSAFRL